MVMVALDALAGREDHFPVHQTLRMNICDLDELAVLADDFITDLQISVLLPSVTSEDRAVILACLPVLRGRYYDSRIVTAA